MNDIENDNWDLIKDFLPKNYEYKRVSQRIYDQRLDTFQFDLELRVKVNSEEEVKNFLQDLDSSSGCSFNQLNGRPDKRPKGAKATSSLRGYRKCCNRVIHNEKYGHKQPGKNTDCGACILFRLENPIGKTIFERVTHPLWINVQSCESRLL